MLIGKYPCGEDTPLVIGNTNYGFIQSPNYPENYKSSLTGQTLKSTSLISNWNTSKYLLNFNLCNTFTTFILHML